MTDRLRLPHRRQCEIFEFSHDGIKYLARLGRYKAARIGEVFLNSAKLTSAADIAARDGAIALSFALQYGASIDDIRKAMTRDAAGRSEGVIGCLLDKLAEADATEKVA